MGTWGEKPWENDIAADWFSLCMEKVDTGFILGQVESILDTEDNEDKLRAAAYLIGHLGRIYIWPNEEIASVKKIKEKLIISLEQMLEVDSEFMELWENDETVRQEVEKEIQILKE